MRRRRSSWKGPVLLTMAGLTLATMAGVAAFGLWLVLESTGGSVVSDVVRLGQDQLGVDFGVGKAEDHAPVWVVAAFVFALVVCACGCLAATAGTIWGMVAAARSDTARKGLNAGVAHSKQGLARGRDQLDRGRPHVQRLGDSARQRLRRGDKTPG